MTGLREYTGGSNRAFQQGLYALAHPVSLGAIGLMPLNDHVLKGLWPGWVTGKLSDLTWVVFTPLVFTLALAWLVPPHIKRRPDIVIGLALALTGVAYALFNATDWFHAHVVTLLSLIEGAPVVLVRDSTDNIVIPPGLALAWWAWRTAPRVSTRQGVALVATCAAVMATVATSSPPPNWGITCLAQEGTTIEARNHPYAMYVSDDGGRTWAPVALEDGYVPYSEACSGKIPRQAGYNAAPEMLLETNAGDFRLRRGAGIDFRPDASAPWQQEIDLSSVSHHARLAGLRARLENEEGVATNPRTTAGPFDAVYDIQTGNVVVAMGHDGLLVRTGEGWEWVAAGPHRLREITRDDIYPQGWPLFLAALLFVLLTPGTAYVLASHPASLGGRVLLALACVSGVVMLLVLTRFLFPTDDARAIDLTPLIAMGLGSLSATLAIGGGFLSYRAARLAAPGPLLAAGLAAWVFATLPYLLWMEGALGSRWMAAGLALALQAAIAVAAAISISQAEPGGSERSA